MSAGYLAGPADRFGPCAKPCPHLDCAATRAMAGQTCRLCQKPMGFGVYFYDDDEVTYPDLVAGRHPIVHARCLEMQAAAARNGGAK